MTHSASASFDHTVQTTNVWLKDLMRRLDWDSRDRSWHAFRVVLHALRDQLTAEENAALAAQLPLLIRGLYFEAWRPAAKFSKMRKKDAFLEHVRTQLGDVSITETQMIVQAVLAVLNQHISKGEIDDMKHLLPHELRAMWPDEYYGELRQRMIDHQLRRRGIKDPLVLQAMSEVPREEFVPVALKNEAYDDYPLPIGFGQTISQPYTVAYLVELLELKGNEKVLDVGTGSGYQAAILSRLAPVVHTVERIPQLAQQAKTRLQRLGYDNVHVHVVDGSLGFREEAPFDAIVVAACAEKLPSAYVDQLSEGGRLVVPLGSHPQFQKLFRFTKVAGEMRQEDKGSFGFVPLIGDNGWREA